MEVTGSLAALWEGVEAFDDEQADSALGRLLGDVPLADALTRVVIPLLSVLGDRWEDGTLSVAHEHFASNLVRRRLTALTPRALPGGASRPRVLLACPPGERHDLALLCFSLLLGERGWRPLFLGADTPMAALATAARAVDARAVVLASTRATAFTAHSTSIAKLARRHPVYVAGRGADAEVARVVGAGLLPGDLAEAVESLGPVQR